MTFTLFIERGTGSYATSFDVWAKEGSYPECDGDGIYIGNVPIGADEDEVSYEPTIDDPEDYKYIAIPLYLDQVGLPGRLEEA
jgi:hypothetical protein